MTTLPPYSGPNPTCPKCSHEEALTEYRAYGECIHDGTTGSIGLQPNERLHRECLRCSYAWDEALNPAPDPAQREGARPVRQDQRARPTRCSHRTRHQPHGATMTTTATATQLQTIATLWPDLQTALAAPTQHSWPPVELSGYLQAMEKYNATDAAALRALERSPDQLGTRPVPISIRIHDTMRAVEAALHETATQIAATNQLSTSRPHPHRWYFTGRPRGAAWTAVWLSARAEGKFWPGRALTEAQHRHLSHVAAEALRRVETALDLATSTRELGPEHTCQCGGRITIRGGAGNQPTAHCRQCGALWTERGVVAA